eukprot:4998322-Prymnesium_polylepis.1
MFASFDVSHPGIDSFQYHGASGYSGRAGVMHITHTDPHFCTLWPCNLYLSVSVYDNRDTWYSLTVVESLERPVRLFDGESQQIESAANEWRYFKFTTGTNVSTFTISATATTGDPDIYVSSDGVLPTDTHFSWHAAAAGEDMLTINVGDPGWCLHCTYLIGVSSTISTVYTISAATSTATLLLDDGVPVERSVRLGHAQFYRIYIPTGGPVDVTVSLTPLSGDADIYASTTEHQPDESRATVATGWSSSNHGTGQDSIRALHTDPAMRSCQRSGSQCVLYIGVYGRSSVTLRCAYTI